MSEVPLYRGASLRRSRPPRKDQRRALGIGLLYRGISLITNRASLGPYSRPEPRVLAGS